MTITDLFNKLIPEGNQITRAISLANEIMAEVRQLGNPEITMKHLGKPKVNGDCIVIPIKDLEVNMTDEPDMHRILTRYLSTVITEGFMEYTITPGYSRSVGSVPPTISEMSLGNNDTRLVETAVYWYIKICQTNCHIESDV